MYRFYNVNPMGKLEEDCVTRAIKLALNEDYDTVQYKLHLIAELFNCDALCVCCYKHLLDDVYKLPRITTHIGKPIKEFLCMYPKGVYLIRVDGHLTCAIDGTVYDIWDCQNEIIDIIWKV